MRLIISEKGDLAKKVAAAVGASTYQNGYYSGNGFYVVAARGHLFEMLKPDEIDPKYKQWNLDDLPILPASVSKKLKPDCAAIFEKIKKLADSKDVTVIYNNGDSDAEGQILIQEILDAIHCPKPIKRIWNSSMDPDDIRKAVKDAKPDSDYHNLLLSAAARGELDWLYGMNLSRLMSIRGNAVLPVGRVQTPVLALICKRAEEVENFKSVPYYQIAANDSTIGIPLIYCDDNWEKVSFKTENEAKSEAAKMAGAKGKITSATLTNEKISKPMIYTTSALEADANRVYHISPSDTLDAMEALYMAGITSYPRTDCCYLFQNMEGEFNQYIDEIATQYPDTAKYVTAMKKKDFQNSYIYNDKKVDEHTGIILTKGFGRCSIASLPQNEQNILRLVVIRMLEVCAPNAFYNKLTIKAEAQGCNFYTTASAPVSEGFLVFRRVLLGGQRKKKATLPKVNKGDAFSVDSTDIVEVTPKRPRYYTEGEIIKLMENISKEAPAQYHKVLKDCEGLGTGATRAAIIESLRKHHGSGEAMVNLVKNSLVPTITGRYLIASVSEEIKSPVMTAQMETSLDQIRKGTLDSSNFIAETKNHLSKLVASGKSMNITPMQQSSRKVVGKCPRCGRDVVEFDKTFSCTGYKMKTCDFGILKENHFFTKQKKKLTATIVSQLLSNKQTRVQGFTSQKTGKKYDATIILDDPGKGLAKLNVSFT